MSFFIKVHTNRIKYPVLNNEVMFTNLNHILTIHLIKYVAAFHLNTDAEISILTFNQIPVIFNLD